MVHLAKIPRHCLTTLLASSAWASIVSGSLALASPASLPSEENWTRVNNIVEGLRRSVLQCPERVWPDYSWAKMTLFLSDKTKREGFKWSAADPESIVSVAFESIPAVFTSSSYSYNRDLENPILGLSLSANAAFTHENKFRSEADFLIGFGVHEAFHGFETNWWPRGEAATGPGRATVYPVVAEPRYLRYMMLKTMKNYLENPREEQLNQLAAIYAHYRATYPAEAKTIRYIDRVEGSAQYAGVVAEVLAQRSCTVEDEELISMSTAVAFKDSFLGLSISGESYLLGTAAGLIMRNRAPYKGWEKQIESGRTPLEILVNDRPLASYKGDADALDAINAMAAAKNITLAAIVGQFLQDKADPKNVAVFLPDDRRNGSYAVKQLISVPAEGFELADSYAAAYSARDGTEGLIRVTTTVQERSRARACSNSNGATFYVDKDLLGDVSGKTVTITSPKLTADRVPFEWKQDETGRTLLCL